MTKTRDELVERALKLLGAVAAGQTASDEDQETVDAQVETVTADLAARRIVYVADPDEYEDDVFLHIAVCLAAAVSPDFGEDFATWETRRADAEAKLKIITRRTGTGSMLKTDDLTGLDVLRGRYWYDWTRS